MLILCIAIVTERSMGVEWDLDVQLALEARVRKATIITDSY